MKIFMNSGLIISGKNPELYFYENRDNVLRSEHVEMNGYLFEKGSISVGDDLTMDLFDEAEYKYKVISINKNIEGTITITLRSNTSESDFIILTGNSDRISMNYSVSGSGKLYQIISDPGTKKHFIIESYKIDAGELEGGPGLYPADKEIIIKVED